MKMSKDITDVVSSTQNELEKLVADLRGLLSSRDLDSVPEIKVLRQRLDKLAQQIDSHLASESGEGTGRPWARR